MGSLIAGMVSKRVGISKCFYYSALVDMTILGMFVLYQLSLRTEGVQSFQKLSQSHQNIEKKSNGGKNSNKRKRII